MFVEVLFGEKEKEIFNPNCRCISFLATIKEKCNYSDDIDIDLSDESGNVKNLRDMPYRYASEFLNDRERVVLLRVDSQDTGDCAYTPLLHDDEFVSENFLAQLASRAMDLSQHSGRRNRGSASRRNKLSSQNRDNSAKNGFGSTSSLSKSIKPTSKSKTRIK